MFPIPWKLFHHVLKAGAMLWPSATRKRAEAKPAMKLLMLGLSDGRYKKPEPAECSGIMKTSYFPGGSPPPAVVLGASPCGGGGGGALIVGGTLQD